MNAHTRKMAEAWVDQTFTHLQTAKSRAATYAQNAEAIQAAQACVELSVKAILTYLDLAFAKTHGWDGKELQDLAVLIRKRRFMERLAEQHVYLRLPRLLFLASFWEKFYSMAKYGMEAGSLAPPNELFEKAEVELAVQHAEECRNAAIQMRCMEVEKLVAIVGKNRRDSKNGDSDDAEHAH